MMLDIAGGSGAHAIGALQKWPQLKGTVYEMSPVSGFVSEYAKQYGLSDRLLSVTGDMWKDPFAAGRSTFLFASLSRLDTRKMSVSNREKLCRTAVRRPTYRP